MRAANSLQVLRAAPAAPLAAVARGDGGGGEGNSPDRDPPASTAFMDTIQVGFAGIDLRNGNNSPTGTVSIFTRTGSSDPEMATHPHTSPQERLHVHTPRQQGPGEDRALKRICARAFSAARLLSSWHPGWPLAQHTCPGLSLFDLGSLSSSPWVHLVSRGPTAGPLRSEASFPWRTSSPLCLKTPLPALPRTLLSLPAPLTLQAFPVCLPSAVSELPEGRDCCRLGSLLCPAQNLT